MKGFREYLCESGEPLNLKIKERAGDIYTAYHKGKKVGHAQTWDEGGKFSIYKSATHEDYRKRGVMTALYKHIESTTGKQLHPSSSLSDDAHGFWSKYRPEAVKDDLRNHREKLMGKEVEHPRHGKGVIDTVVAGGVGVKMPNGNTYTLHKNKVNHLL